MSSIRSYNSKKIRNVADVARWRMCSGCGACAAVCPNRTIQLIDVPEEGIRPVVNTNDCTDCGSCLEVCPGLAILQKTFNADTKPELRLSWGPVLEIWEGYASDDEIRFKGSSGGIATALSLFCLEKLEAGSVLQTGVAPGNPLENIFVFSRNRNQLVASTGSRYSPAAPCVGFREIEANNSNCVFVGRPCDVAGLRKAQSASPALATKTPLSISIFCAGTPSSKGTEALLDELNVRPGDVKELRYRGCGWPGMATVTLNGTQCQQCQMSYEKSWGEILSRHVPLRCRLCPDGTGELADISCGDPWYKPIEGPDAGQSLVLVRTEKGREVLAEAMKAGYVILRPVDSSVVAASQPSLLNKRRQLWGRLLAMRIARVPTPDFNGFSLFANWRRLSFSAKIRSLAGTFRRIITRQLYRPLEFFQANTERKNVFPAVPAGNRAQVEKWKS